MEQENTTNPNEKNEQKKVTPKQNKKENKESFSEKFADYKAEFRKIIWPNRSELTKKTFTVIVTSLVMSIIIFGMDTIYTSGYNFILGLLS